MYFNFSNLSHKRKKLSLTIRAVKKFLSSRLIMNSKRLWNSHQRHKFLGAEASRDILKIRVSEMVFPGVFKRFFPQRMPCCFVRTNARLGTLPSKCPRRSKTSDGVKRSTDLTCLNNFMCSMLFKTGAYFLLAVMVERDESRGLRMTN